MPEAIPQNAPYMVAAYVVTAVILVGYAIVLARRARGSRDS
jgi:hypothetical protein